MCPSCVYGTPTSCPARPSARSPLPSPPPPLPLHPACPPLQTAQTAATYLLVAASAERFLSAYRLSDRISDRNRLFVILGPPPVLAQTLAQTSPHLPGSILIAMAMKGTLFLEIKAVHRPHCPGWPNRNIDSSSLTRKWAHLGIREYVLMPSELMHLNGTEPTTYNVVFTYWIRHVATIFLPFFVLLFLNAGIVHRSNLLSAYICHAHTR